MRADADGGVGQRRVVDVGCGPLLRLQVDDLLRRVSPDSARLIQPQHEHWFSTSCWAAGCPQIVSRHRDRQTKQLCRPGSWGSIRQNDGGCRRCTSRICSLTLVAYASGKMLSSTSSLPWPDASTKSCSSRGWVVARTCSTLAEAASCRPRWQDRRRHGQSNGGTVRRRQTVLTMATSITAEGLRQRGAPRRSS